MLVVLSFVDAHYAHLFVFVNEDDWCSAHAQLRRQFVKQLVSLFSYALEPSLANRPHLRHTLDFFLGFQTLEALLRISEKCQSAFFI
jgi:hypothetical protein